jgi:hypothetical protein
MIYSYHDQDKKRRMTTGQKNDRMQADNATRQKTKELTEHRRISRSRSAKWLKLYSNVVSPCTPGVINRELDAYEFLLPDHPVSRNHPP